MITCYFDISSPWTWLAFRRLQRMAAALDTSVDWKPILVGGVFNAVNPSVYEFRERGVPAKQAYLRKDLADWARHEGIRILFPPTIFPVNSVKAMRACLWLQPQGKLEPFAAAAFEAYWTHDQDISSETVLRDLCEQIGIDGAALFEGITEPVIKTQLKVNTDALITRGGFGSPTFFVGDDDMYFGNDRLELVREAVLAHRR
jgi:2-hydroxychromene-2-carboxylate isomerase